MRSFNALVKHPGNFSLVKSVQLSLLALLNGSSLHIHAEGVRGTGKTSIMRACRSILPSIERVRGCQFNCDPVSPHCPEHRYLDAERLTALGTESIQMPFLEISPSARLGTVVGSLDLERLTATDGPEAAVLPGTIPQAHRGVVFVDEINRLADTAPELADVLLDVMGTRPGRIQIEETGLPRVELPVTVSVWAASNPDEEPGPLEEIRRQLSDRFDLVVPVRRPARRELIEQILGLSETEPDGEDPNADRLLSDRVMNCCGSLESVVVPTRIRQVVASAYVEFQLESLRAAQALQAGARLNALLDGSDAVRVDDLLFVAPLVLEHRVDPQLIPRILKYLETWQEDQEGRRPAPPAPIAAATKSGSAPAMSAGTSSAGGSCPDRQMAAGGATNSANTTGDEAPRSWWQRAVNRLGGNEGSAGGPCGRSVERDTRPEQSTDPARVPVLAPPHRAARLAELDERRAVSEPGDGPK